VGVELVAAQENTVSRCKGRIRDCILHL
jgi:hypothetical protein